MVDWKLIVGALCFGLGWGIGGICPGPALVLLPVFQVQIHVVWIASLILGMFIAGKLIGQDEKKIGFESAEAQQPSKSRPSKPI